MADAWFVLVVPGLSLLMPWHAGMQVHDESVDPPLADEGTYSLQNTSDNYNEPGLATSSETQASQQAEDPAPPTAHLPTRDGKQLRVPTSKNVSVKWPKVWKTS